MTKFDIVGKHQSLSKEEIRCILSACSSILELHGKVAFRRITVKIQPSHRLIQDGKVWAG